MTAVESIASAATPAAPEVLRDGRQVLLRPARAGDAAQIQCFVRALSPQSRRNRFFSTLAELSHYLLRRLAEPAADEFVLLAWAGDGGESHVVGIVQYVPEEPLRAEFGVVVADAWQRSGLGTRLVRALIVGAAASGIRTLCAVMLADNTAMLALARRLGCALAADAEPGLVRMEKHLAPPPAPAITAARLPRRRPGQEFRGDEHGLGQRCCRYQRRRLSHWELP
jgi:RimJ/RimL family protein N-acetyltransferase